MKTKLRIMLLNIISSQSDLIFIYKTGIQRWIVKNMIFFFKN